MATNQPLTNRTFTRFQYRTVLAYCQEKPDLNIIPDLLKVMKQLGSEQGSILTELCEASLAPQRMSERQERIKRLAGKYTGKVYYSFWSRDCDLCESTEARGFANEFEAQEYIDNFYDYAEGPCSHTRITGEQYKAFESSFYDRAAAQMGY